MAVKIVVGENDFISYCKQNNKEYLVDEWDVANNDITMESVSGRSGKKASWICSKGHSWIATISSRTGGSGCPVCANQQVLEGYNDLATTNPEILKEWDFGKNEKTPTEVIAGSRTKIWWKCDKGHSFLASIGDRTKKNASGCPYCSGRKVIEGENDLATLYPNLLKEWDYEKNSMIGIDPQKIKAFSHIKVWWICEKKHEWMSGISSRSKGVGCPVCTNVIVVKGINDLATTNPELLTLWDYERNVLKPDEITNGSGIKIWWKCANNHSFDRRVIDQIKRKYDCPYCSGSRSIEGETDFATLYPDLLEEWDYEKNNIKGIFPTKVKGKSNFKVSWICKRGHRWIASINGRTTGSGCPICNNHQVLEGYNDLGTTNPELLSTWNFKKNIITPQEVTKGSDKKVWWICEKGHEWEATIGNRVRVSGCPMCSREVRTSFPEQAIYYYVKQSFPKAKNGDREKIYPYELDIFIPELNVAIEYDGQAWHNNNSKDLKKNNECEKQGIRLFRVREDMCSPIENNYSVDYYYDGSDYDKLSEIISRILKELQCEETSIDVNRDRQYIYEQYLYKIKENSFVEQYPELVKQWNYNRNVGLNPNKFGYASEKKVWWICEKGHEWEAIIGNRVKGRGCPICSNHKVLAGYNDFASKFPKDAEEFDYSRNDFSPTDYTYGSEKKAWWKCRNGHEYQMSFNGKSSGHKCPICSNHQVLVGYNDLATTNPELIESWNYKKNIITPQEVSKGSEKKVWWICEKGHEWQTGICNRVSGSGCLICANRQVLAGYNDFASKFPKDAEEFDYSRNDFSPSDYTYGSEKIAWWKCRNGHEYQMSFNGKSRGYCCPYCSKRKKDDNK